MEVLSKRALVSSILLFAFGAGAHYGLEQRKFTKNIELAKEALSVFNKQDIEVEVGKYHSRDYVQYSDGKVLHYDDFIKHVKHVKSVIASPLTFDFDLIAPSGDYVTTIHRAKAVKKNGEKIEIKVIAVFKIKDNKIVSVDELSSVISGDKEDSELGSKH